jgi:hypothetical protein
MLTLRAILCIFGVVSLTATAGCSSGGDDSTAAGGQDITAAAKKTADVRDARFHELKNGPTNKSLQPLNAAGNKMDSSLIGTYKFLKPTDEATNQASREKRVKEVMHRFMCGFFDESIDLGHDTGAQGAKNAINDLDLGTNDSDGGDSPGAKGVVAAMDAVTKDKDLDVMSGSASGNNTAGEIMGVYDMKNHEIFFFGFSNCGSDN